MHIKIRRFFDRISQLQFNDITYLFNFKKGSGGTAGSHYYENSSFTYRTRE